MNYSGEERRAAGRRHAAGTSIIETLLSRTPNTQREPLANFVKPTSPNEHECVTFLFADIVRLRQEISLSSFRRRWKSMGLCLNDMFTSSALTALTCKHHKVYKVETIGDLLHGGRGPRRRAPIRGLTPTSFIHQDGRTIRVINIRHFILCSSTMEGVLSRTFLWRRRDWTTPERPAVLAALLRRGHIHLKTWPGASRASWA